MLGIRTPIARLIRHAFSNSSTHFDATCHCFFECVSLFLCNRHRFNRFPGEHLNLGIACTGPVCLCTGPVPVLCAYRLYRSCVPIACTGPVRLSPVPVLCAYARRSGRVFLLFYVIDTASTGSRGRTCELPLSTLRPYRYRDSEARASRRTLACNSVCRGFIFKVPGPSPSRGQFGVRQKGAYRTPPP